MITDDPTKLPAPGDVALCPSPATPIGGNPDSDPDGKAPGIFAESNKFDGDCTLYSNPGNRVRNLDWVLQTPWDISLNANETVLVEGKFLLKRGARAANAIIKLCLPGGQTSSLTPQAYSGFRTVARLADKGWIHVAKPLTCGVAGLLVSKVQPEDGTEFVTEHVFEKQQFRNAIQWMAKGKLPGGSTLAAGAANLQGVFTEGGVGTTKQFVKAFEVRLC